MKKVLDSKLFYILIGIVMGSTSLVVASNYIASDIAYTPKDSNWKVSNVADAINSLASKSGTVNYSTDEQTIGTWIDGKPLYQKTIVTSLPNTSTDGSAVTNGISYESIGLNNIDTIWLDESASFKTSGSMHSEEAWSYNVGHYSSSNWGSMVWCSNDAKIYVRNTRKDQNGIKVILTLKYTKTTDQVANS